MSDRNNEELNKDLARFYQNHSLPPETVDHLLAQASGQGDMADSPPPLGHAKRSEKPGRGVFLGGLRRPVSLPGVLAACAAAIVVSAAFYFVPESGHPADIARPEQRLDTPALTGPAGPSPPSVVAESNPPSAQDHTAASLSSELAASARLVAVSVRVDFCPRCIELAPIFDELMNRYMDDPVLFVTLDVTDQTRRGQAVETASTLDIEYAFAQRYEFGTIRLIDRRDRAVLAVVRGRDDVADLENALAGVLKATDD